MVPVAGWKETQVSDTDFDTIMEKAYEEYFEGLAEGEEAQLTEEQQKLFSKWSTLTDRQKQILLELMDAI